MAVASTKANSILVNAKAAVEDTGHFELVDTGFVSPFKIGSRFPACLILPVDTDFPERRQRRRVLTLHFFYYAQDQPGSSIPLYKALNTARDAIIGSADASSAYYGGLKLDPKRGGYADWTELVRDARNAEVFAPFGADVAVFPPYGAGRLEVRCPYLP